MLENTPLIETDTLILRKFTPQDVDALFILLRDKTVNTFLPWLPLETMEQTQEFLQNKFLLPYRLPTSYHYAVCLKSDNIPIGYVNISDGESHDLGYALRAEFWHKGIITQACKGLAEHLRKTDFPFITATHDIHNWHSGEVMKKIGMKYQYTYEERVQPKNKLISFRMYQLNFDGQKERTYMEYWNKYEKHYIETDV